MELLELLEYVNNGLSSGKSLVDIAKELGKNESTIRKNLNKKGYKRVDNTFVFQGVVQGAVQEVVQRKEVATVGIVEPLKGISVYEGRKELTDLIENHSILLEMIEQYKNNSVVQTGGIVVHLPFEEDKGYKISMRVNKPVMDRFKEFCGNNKTFTQKDLLSMALIEYMENHK